MRNTIIVHTCSTYPTKATSDFSLNSNLTMFISPFSPPQFSVTAQPPRPPLATTILDPGSSSSPIILPSSVDKVVPGGTGIIMSRPRIPRCFRPLSSMLHNEVREQLERGQLNYTIGIEKQIYSVVTQEKLMTEISFHLGYRQVSQ